MSDKRTIIKQINKAVLVKIDSEVEVGDKTFKGVEYEIWSDIDKMISGIRTDENGKPNFKSISALNDDEPKKIFEGLYGQHE